MVFNPQNITVIEGCLTLVGNINAVAHPSLNKEIIKEFWYNFSFQSSTLNIEESNEFVFSIGTAKPLPIDCCDYSINIAQDGVCVCAENEQNLIKGFMTLLDRFKAVDCDEALAIEIDCCKIKDKPLMQNRMVHFCIFPETELFFWR